MESMEDRFKNAVRGHALKNAIQHGGKADAKAVLGKTLAGNEEFRAEAKRLAPLVQSIVDEVNNLSLKEQRSVLSSLGIDESAPSKRIEEEHKLPPLPNAVKGHVVLRLPPEPSGFMHIGHAMAGMINYLYKKTYSGQLWLRFEDTNPRKVATKYFESFREGYKWLGIEWDEEKCVSTDLETTYEHARRLLENGHAYACTCDSSTVKKLRFEGSACQHRGQSEPQNLSIWEKMVARGFKEGECVVRLKGDMNSPDYSLRDPNIVRVVEHEHPLTGNKYTVWPTYDFAVVVEDELCGVTHILRSSEFHAALQEFMRRLLSFRAVEVLQFSRFNFRGTPIQKRLLRPLVEKGLVSGWDDPRMPTIEGVRRRGILPEAIKEFTMQVGYTKAEHVFDWSLIFAVNRKLIDPTAKRLFFVPRPLMLKVQGAASKTLQMPFHPDRDIGSRSVNVGSVFYVPSDDISRMDIGGVFRLIDLYNVRLVAKHDGIAEAEFVDEELRKDVAKLQWVTQENSHIRVLEPSMLFNDDGTYNEGSLKMIDGYVEPAFNEIREGEIVQFPRYGFCRVDSDGVCILSHR